MYPIAKRVGSVAPRSGPLAHRKNWAAIIVAAQRNNPSASRRHWALAVLAANEGGGDDGGDGLIPPPPPPATEGDGKWLKWWLIGAIIGIAITPILLVIWFGLQGIVETERAEAMEAPLPTPVPVIEEDSVSSSNEEEVAGSVCSLFAGHTPSGDQLLVHLSVDKDGAETLRYSNAAYCWLNEYVANNLARYTGEVEAVAVGERVVSLSQCVQNLPDAPPAVEGVRWCMSALQTITTGRGENRFTKSGVPVLAQTDWMSTCLPLKFIGQARVDPPPHCKGEGVEKADNHTPPSPIVIEGAASAS